MYLRWAFENLPVPREVTLEFLCVGTYAQVTFPLYLRWAFENLPVTREVTLGVFVRR